MPKFPIEERFRSGKDLYGDDFDADAIAAWFRDEENAYANLWHAGSGAYDYHALNCWHGYRHLPAGPLQAVLAFGSAHGRELEPLVGRLREVTLLDSSESFDEPDLLGVQVQRKKAGIAGDLEFSADTFDLVTCFGVLHHIPNVTHILGEFHRILRPGGWLLMREPSTSMGDWTKPRPGLTPHERGIPRRWMTARLVAIGFELARVAPCQFSPLMAAGHRFGMSYAQPATIRIDALFSQLFAWNQRYASEKNWQKFRPGSVFYVARKAETPGSAPC